MQGEHEFPMLDLYEALQVPRDATTEEIAAALETYRARMRDDLTNPLTMKGALNALNVIIPAIEDALLSGHERRTRYDQWLKDFESRATQPLDERADEQRLDERFSRPFFFDPYTGYDTETPAFTLREIAARLDQERERVRTWLTDTSRPKHPLVLYLKHVALCPRLAERIEGIIQCVLPGAHQRMDVNEAIERCIMLLDPTLEQPTVAISDTKFDSRTWTLIAGQFLPEKGSAQSTLTLRHIGQRGCVFGSVESLTDWLKLPNKQSTSRFALMVEGTAASIGLSSINLPLIFDLSGLAHKATHTAELVVHIDNLATEIHLKVSLEVLAQPPLVTFEPIDRVTSALSIAAVRQGVPATVVITARNRGDEAFIPLVARLSSRTLDISIRPDTFHSDEPITITVDTGNKRAGTTYNLELDVDYSITSGAQGPTKLYIHGEVLPTSWQSLLRERAVMSRLLTTLIGAGAGFLVLGGLGAALEGHLFTLWSLVLPVIFICVARAAAKTTVSHMQRSGEENAWLADVPSSVLWWLPIGSGVFLDIICGILPDPSLSFTFAGVIGSLFGLVMGFLLDKTGFAKVEETVLESKQRLKRL